MARNKKADATNPASPHYVGDKNTTTFTDPRDGQTYRTIELNGLTWLAVRRRTRRTRGTTTSSVAAAIWTASTTISGTVTVVVV